RRVRRVGLVLIDERRGGVFVFVNVIGGAEYAVGTGLICGARQHHEVGGCIVGIAGDAVGPWIVERVIGLERDEDGAAAALGDEIEAVIEELTEEGHPGIERRGQTRIGRDVGYEIDLGIVGG